MNDVNETTTPNVDSELDNDSDLGSSSTWYSKYTDILLNHARKFLGLSIVILFIMGYGLTSLGLTTDNRVFFGPDNPQLTAFEQFERIYTESNNVVIAFSPKLGNVFNTSTLSAIEEFTERAWQLPFSSRVDSLNNFQHTYAENDELVIADLFSSGAKLTDTQIEKIKNTALTEPLLVNRLISTDGSMAATIVNFRLPNRTDEKSINKIVTALKSLQQEIETKYPDLTLYLTGDIVLGAAVGEATQDDVSSVIPIMFILILAIVALLQRSVTALISTTVIILFTAVTTLGLAGWLGYMLNPGSAIAPTIIITISAAYCVHIINSVLNNIRVNGNKRNAIAKAIQDNFSVILLTCVTTIIGFLSMLFSDSPPFHDLGILVSIGVFFAFILVFTILPILLFLLPCNPGNGVENKFSENIVIRSIIKLTVRQDKIIFFGIILSIVIAIFGATKINLIDDWVEYFDERYTFRTDSDYIIDHLSGIEALEFSLDSGSENGISSPEYLKVVDNFVNWLREQPGISYVYSISDIIKRINKNMHNDDEDFYKIPDNVELAAQYLLLYEISLPFGLSLEDRMSFKKSALRVSAVGDLNTIELRMLEQRAKNWLIENAPEQMVTNATGMSIIFAHISGRNINTMLSATFFALIAISFILIFALKSIKLGLISLIPNVIPAAIAIGLWGWFYGQLGMAIAVVGAMTLGIIVDDTIHFLSRFRKAIDEKNYDSEQAIRYAFDSVGRALFTTTCALVVGFGVLAFSGFLVNWAMGILAAMIIAVALLTDFILLPFILNMAYKKKFASATPSSSTDNSTESKAGVSDSRKKSLS